MPKPKAEARMETAQAVAETTVAAVVEAPKTAGVGYRMDYGVSVDDPALATRFCANNPMLQHCVTLDLGAIKKLAVAMKGKLQIDGLRIVEKPVAIIRT